MKLIAGLGNYGLKYQKTFHNVGFIAADIIAKELNVKFDKREGNALTAHYRAENGEKAIIVKPLTYMNLSGESISSLMRMYKIPLSDVLVIYDDIDLEKGALRIRKSGSAGTHNGMRNIVSLIGEDFMRVRVGIGRPDNAGFDVANYVLSRIPSVFYDELKDEILRNASAAAIDFINNLDNDKIMLKYNTKGGC